MENCPCPEYYTVATDSDRITGDHYPRDIYPTLLEEGFELPIRKVHFWTRDNTHHDRIRAIAHKLLNDVFMEKTICFKLQNELSPEDVWSRISDSVRTQTFRLVSKNYTTISFDNYDELIGKVRCSFCSTRLEEKHFAMMLPTNDPAEPSHVNSTTCYHVCNDCAPRCRVGFCELCAAMVGAPDDGCLSYYHIHMLGDSPVRDTREEIISRTAFCETDFSRDYPEDWDPLERFVPFAENLPKPEIISEPEDTPWRARKIRCGARNLSPPPAPKRPKTQEEREAEDREFWYDLHNSGRRI